jgi:hypothetical protein
MIGTAKSPFMWQYADPPPPAEATAPKRKLLLDPSDALHRELGSLLVSLATPTLSQAAAQGLLYSLDPYFLDDAVSRSVLACIFSITLVWPLENIPRSTIEKAVDSICKRNPESPAELDISYKFVSPDKEHTTECLSSLMAFARTPEALFVFAQRPPAASLTLSVTFPFQCPQEIMDKKKIAIAKRLWQRVLTIPQLDAAFPRAYATVDPDRPIGRISNTFHARFGLPREEDPASARIFSELCTIHYEFKRKILDTDMNRNHRISSLSFSFITDKGSKRRHKAPEWFDSAHSRLLELRPDLLADPPSSDSGNSGNHHQQQQQQQ